jgi:hypothetical protein
VSGTLSCGNNQVLKNRCQQCHYMILCPPNSLDLNLIDLGAVASTNGGVGGTIYHTRV